MHWRSPSRPGSPVGGGQAGPVPGSGHLLTGAGARGRGRRRSARPRLCHGAQVAGDTVGLMEALAVDGQKSQIAQSPKANTLYCN